MGLGPDVRAHRDPVGVSAAPVVPADASCAGTWPWLSCGRLHGAEPGRDPVGHPPGQARCHRLRSSCFASSLVPVPAGTVDWQRAFDFHLVLPFQGVFGGLTSAMAGLYLIGFAAPAFEAATCHVGETIDPVRNVRRAVWVSAGMAGVYFVRRAGRVAGSYRR